MGFRWYRFDVAIAAAKLWLGAKRWSGESRGWVWLAGAAALVGLALVSPRILTPFNRLSGRFSALLHRLLTPVVFVTTAVPIGLEPAGGH